MRKLIAASLIALMASPAFANVANVSTESDQQGNEQTEFLSADQANSIVAEEARDVSANAPWDRGDRWDDRWGHRYFFTCIAENRFRQRFVGHARLLNMARQQALRSCYSRSVLGGCILRGCYRR